MLQVVKSFYMWYYTLKEFKYQKSTRISKCCMSLLVLLAQCAFLHCKELPLRNYY